MRRTACFIVQWVFLVGGYRIIASYRQQKSGYLITVFCTLSPCCLMYMPGCEVPVAGVPPRV